MTYAHDLAGTSPVLLGTDVQTREPVCLPYEDRPRGVALIGKAGTGKSTLFEHLIRADLEQGTPGMVIDPHGLLAQRVMQMAPPEHADRIILLEASQSAPFGLNLLAVRKPVDKEDDPVAWAADSVVATVKKLYGQDDEFLPRLEHWLDIIAHTLIPNNGTLLDALRLFRNDKFRRQCLRNVTDPEILDEWARYESLRATDQIIHTEAVVNRLGRMLRPPLIRGIIGSQETTVPLDEILNGDSMLLVSLPSETLSLERSNFIGSLLLSVLADRIFTRKVETTTPPRLHIYLDEYQRFATTTTTVLAEQGRKYGVGLTMAHQTLQQIRDPRIRDASRHAGTLILLGVTRPDAEELAGEFPVKPREEWIERIKEIDGEEPERVPVANPCDYLRSKTHPDPFTDEAARILIPPPMGNNLLTPRRSKPGDINLDHPLLPAQEPMLNALLIQAMNHELDDDDALVNALVKNQILYKGSHYTYNGVQRFFKFEEFKEGDYPRVPSGYRERNGLVERFYEQATQRLFEEGFRPWIKAVLEIMAKTSEWIDADYGPADNALIAYAHSQKWENIFGCWYGLATDSPQYDSASDCAEQEVLNAIEQRLQWIVPLCDGLSAHPITEPSGIIRPRMTTRIVVHPSQPQQDALNEFAAQLVNPQKKHVAHIRMLSGYHETKLRPPPDDGEGGGRPVTNPHQPDDIRTRSRALYKTEQEQQASETTKAPEAREIRRVTRRPRPQDNEE